MKISQEVRDYAAAQEAAKPIEVQLTGMEKMSAEFRSPRQRALPQRRQPARGTEQ
jgi:hypothetical protein